MKKQYASILLTLTCFLGLGVGAEGQSQREVVVTVPYELWQVVRRSPRAHIQ